MYYANFSVNNGTSYMYPIKDTDFERLKSDIINIAIGNMFRQSTNTGSCWVDDEEGHELFRGYLGFDDDMNPYVIDADTMEYQLII